LCNICSAQIEFTIAKNDVGCNNFKPGSAKVTVTSINTPYTYLWSAGETANIAKDLPVGGYTVIITDGLMNDTTILISIFEVDCGMLPEIYFTPNGDGYNDEWNINNAQYFPDALVLVYNRWGQKVYEHNGLYNQGWNGNDLFGVPVADASYYYIVYKDKQKKNDIKKGSVSILR